MIITYIYQTTIPIRFTREDAFRAGRTWGSPALFYYMHLMDAHPITKTLSPYYGA